MSAQVSRQPEADRSSDAGMSLIELIVAMGIFSIVVAIFMAGLVTMTRNTVRAEVTADAADSVRRVFQRLDKQLRYADAINLPGAGASGAQYVEFQTPATVSASGVTMCTQWRWVPSTEQVEARVWPAASATLPAWSVVATHVVADATATHYPFEVLLATPEHPRQSMKLSLLLESEASAGQVSTQSLFVARNSSVNSSGNKDANTDGISDLPACWPSGVRP
jgi:prepilin-type N-terminal cleavage/methylation domain-containing protein